MDRQSQLRVDEELGHLIAADARDNTELFVRLVLVLSSGVALWFVTDQLLMIGWAVSYVVMTLAYVWFLRRISMPAPRWILFLALSISVLLASWFAVMMVYLAIIKEGQLILLASCGCVGLALHCLSRNTVQSLASYVDLTATICTGLGISLAAGINAQETWTGIAVSIAGVGATAYFFISYRQIVRERIQLSEQISAEHRDQKVRALGQLTAGVAHDFNNLLTVIKGNIELARVEPDPARSDASIDEAYEAAGRGAALVSQLLAFTRQSRLKPRRIELSPAFEELCVLLKRVLPANIRLTIVPPEKRLSIFADESLFTSALLNLVINARDALGTSEGEIMIRAASAPRATTLIEISDTGPGIPRDLLPKAADPFFTTKKAGEGSGLGLSMVQGFAEQSRGRMELSTAEPSGLVVRLFLPRGP